MHRLQCSFLQCLMVKHILPGGEKTRKHLVVANCFSPATVGCIDLTWQHICKISVPCLVRQGMQIEMCDLRFGVCGFAGHNSRSSVLLTQVLLGFIDGMILPIGLDHIHMCLQCNLPVPML